MPMKLRLMQDMIEYTSSSCRKSYCSTKIMKAVYQDLIWSAVLMMPRRYALQSKLHNAIILILKNREIHESPRFLKLLF